MLPKYPVFFMNAWHRKSLPFKC